jgi:hypothetical protein
MTANPTGCCDAECAVQPQDQSEFSSVDAFIETLGWNDEIMAGQPVDVSVTPSASTAFEENVTTNTNSFTGNWRLRQNRITTELIGLPVAC